ncbi:MAG TPA: ribosome maturation factor RimP [Rhodospirillales bacterium]|jgi:ribosome maturation factor RimP|nr:ribosome maturation factor RimP [Rhodospirillales bacterium]
MSLLGRVERLIAPTVEALGFDLVRVSISGKRKPRVQIMAEPSGGGAMSVDNCADISRAISAVLEVDDPIEGAYTLEVSSPGIDRPLVRLPDFARFAGFEAHLEVSQPIAERWNFRGRLLGVVGNAVRIEVEGGPVEVPFSDIRRAKLVLTDELLAATQDTQAG